MARIQYKEDGEPYRWPNETIIQWPDPDRPYILRQDKPGSPGQILGDYPTLQEAMAAAGYPDSESWEEECFWLRVQGHEDDAPWIDLTEKF